MNKKIIMALILIIGILAVFYCLYFIYVKTTEKTVNETTTTSSVVSTTETTELISTTVSTTVLTTIIDTDIPYETPDCDFIESWCLNGCIRGLLYAENESTICSSKCSNYIKTCNSNKLTEISKLEKCYTGCLAGCDLSLEYVFNKNIGDLAASEWDLKNRCTIWCSICGKY